MRKILLTSLSLALACSTLGCGSSSPATIVNNAVAALLPATPAQKAAQQRADFMANNGTTLSPIYSQVGANYGHAQ